MSLDNLPVEWISLNLGKVVEYGKTAKVEPSQIKDETWVLELEDIEKDSSKILNQISFAERKSKSTKNSFDSGDVLYGKLRPYLNKVVMAPKDGVCTTEIIPLNGNGHVLNKFLFYWIKGNVFQNYVQAVSYGVNMPRLGTNDGLKAPFILVPIAEQKEIVRQLDVMLPQVEQIKARLDAIPAILKKFRQSVLADAVSGKLTTELELKEVLIPNDRGDIKFYINPDWKLSQLKDVADVISGHAFKSSSFTKNGVLAVKISNIQYGYFEIKNQEYLPKEFFSEYDRFVVKNNDLLMALTRPITNNTLKVCRYPKDLESGLLNQRVCKIESNEKIFKDFLELVFQTDYFKQQVEGNLSETLQPNLSPTDLKKFYLGVPHIDEQIQIINIVKNLFAYADKIAETVQSAQKRVNLLTQSILAKAFSGELTAEWREQHQDLITGVNSAEALLAKIQAEREASKPVKKTRAKKAK